MARVHRLEHVERLGAADLSDDDAIGTHAQRVPHEIPDGDCPFSLDVRRPSLEPEHVALIELQLGGILDRHDPLVVRDRRRERVQQRRLPRAGTTRDEDVQLRLDAPLEEVDRLLAQRAEVDHVLEAEALARELADREQRPGQRERMDDRVDTRAVRQARVDHRRRLVDAPSDLGDHPVDDAAEVRVVREAHRRLVQPALTLDPDLARPVDHDLRDGVVREEALERPVAEDVVGDLRREPLAVVSRDAGLAGEVAPDVGDHAVANADRVDCLAGQLRAELADHEHVDRVLQVGERLPRGGRDRRLGRDESLVELHLAHLLLRRRNERDELRFGSGRAAARRAASVPDEQRCKVVERGRPRTTAAATGRSGRPR